MATSIYEKLAQAAAGPKGFIEVQWFDKRVLIATSAIVGAIETGETCKLSLNAPISGIDNPGNILTLGMGYTDLVSLINQAQ